MGGHGTNVIFEVIEGPSSFTSNNLSDKLLQTINASAEIKEQEIRANEDIASQIKEEATTKESINSDEALNTEIQKHLEKVSKEAEQIKNHCKGM